jgi:hypothetical protein
LYFAVLISIDFHFVLVVFLPQSSLIGSEFLFNSLFIRQVLCILVFLFVQYDVYLFFDELVLSLISFMDFLLFLNVFLYGFILFAHVFHVVMPLDHFH